MVFDKLKKGEIVSDKDFNEIYPINIRSHASRHYTPVNVCIAAAHFLSDNSNARILDIGAGAGKFCLIAASISSGMFYGVELRNNLVKSAKKIAERNTLANSNFKCENIIDVEFKHYNAFYFFNAFHENIDDVDPIDKDIVLDHLAYEKYTDYVFNALSHMPEGTKLATYFSLKTQVPDSFQLVNSDFDDNLKLWLKTS